MGRTFLLSIKGDTGPIDPNSIVDARRAGDNVILERLEGPDIDLGDFRGEPGPNTVPTAAAVAAEVNARTLIYSGGAYPARPSGAVGVTYIGPVQPTTWLPNDDWMDNS